MNWHKIVKEPVPVAIVGSGPSLGHMRLSLLADFPGRVIAVNSAWKHLPRWDVWHTVDTLRLTEQSPGPAFSQPQIAAVPEGFGTPDMPCGCDRIEPPAHLLYMRRVRCKGLARKRDEIRTGNSAFGALGIAWHMRAPLVLLLGVDCRDFGRYFYGRREAQPRQDAFLRATPDLFRSAVSQLKRAKVEVVFGSPQSAVDCFPRMHPESALEWIKERWADKGATVGV